MKGYLKIFLTILLILTVISATKGQNVRTYDVTSGLSANTIKDILQDEKGYIWCATSDGLNLFNGVAFRSYGCSYHDPRNDGVSALNALSLLQHRDGNKIWVATQSSNLLLFDPQTETFKSIDLARRFYNLPPLTSVILSHMTSAAISGSRQIPEYLSTTRPLTSSHYGHGRTAALSQI